MSPLQASPTFQCCLINLYLQSSYWRIVLSSYKIYHRKKIHSALSKFTILFWTLFTALHRMYVAALCVARTAELLLGAVYIYAKKTKAL